MDAESASSEPPVWLSGAVLTPLNKLVMPAVWMGAVAGDPLSVYFTSGRLSVAPGFRLLVLLFLAATVFMLWMAARLERVGYCGRELVVADYWREARIPFEQVEAVESVWWGRRQLVRIRFRVETPFGCTVYYVPKWAPVRALFGPPDEELKTLLLPDGP